MDILILFSLIGIGAIIWVAFSKPPEIDPAPRFKPKNLFLLWKNKNTKTRDLYFKRQKDKSGMLRLFR